MGDLSEQGSNLTEVGKGGCILEVGASAKLVGIAVCCVSAVHVFHIDPEKEGSGAGNLKAAEADNGYGT